MKIYKNEPWPIIYLSGTGSSNANEKALIKNGCRFRCYSYAYTCPGAFYYNKQMEKNLKTCLDNGVGIMMDSSAHSFHHLRTQGLRKKSGKWNYSNMDELRRMVVKQYIEYVKKEGKNWDWYVNFDYIKKCPIIYEMQKKLESKGIRPVPVYHGDAPITWVERYCQEGHKLIGIGNVAPMGPYRNKRRYFDKVFNMLDKYGVLAHGFAVTNLSLMFAYPWYSVDSATWAKVAAYGSILYVDTRRNTIGEVHLTDQVVNGKTRYEMLPKELRRAINDETEESGFNIEELRLDGRARSLYNVHFFCHKIMPLKETVKKDFVRWPSLL